VICSRFVQPKNALCPIRVSLSLAVTVFNAVQLVNVSSHADAPTCPNDVKLLISTSSSAVQPANLVYPDVVSVHPPLLLVMLVKYLSSLNLVTCVLALLATTVAAAAYASVIVPLLPIPIEFRYVIILGSSKGIA